MGKLNFMTFLLTILFFCGSLNAQNEEVIERDGGGNRIFTSFRLKAKVFKEILLSAIPLPPKNRQEESSVTPTANDQNIANRQKGEDRIIRIPVKDIEDDSWQKILNLGSQHFF